MTHAACGPRAGAPSIVQASSRSPDLSAIHPELKAEVSTTTYLAATGDYAMVRTFTGRRVGECPPASEAADKAS